jgi:hypothetical protein
MSDTSWLGGVNVAGRASPQGLPREQRLAHERMAALPRRVHLRPPARDLAQEARLRGVAASRLVPTVRGTQPMGKKKGRA